MLTQTANNSSKYAAYLLGYYVAEAGLSLEVFCRQSKRVGQDQVLQCESEGLVTLWGFKY